jgi:hypothetical protein
MARFAYGESVKRLLVIGSGLAVLGLAGSAPAEQPARHGLTFELAVGGGGTLVHAGRTELLGSVVPLSFSLGGFVNPQLALMFRATGTMVFPGGYVDVVVNDFYGPVVAFWPTERLVWSGGLGLGHLVANPWSAGGPPARLGIAANLRASYALVHDARQAVGIGLELTPAVYAAERAVGLALLVEWRRW